MTEDLNTPMLHMRLPSRGSKILRRITMKNIKITIIAIILITAIFVFTACNKTIIDTKYKFEKAHIRINGEWFDVDIHKWNDYEGEQIQLILTDGTVIIINSRDCILYNGTLPTAEKH